jgi:hypothetical protein
MKHCPACNETYSDDSLNFCMSDGSVLETPRDENSSAPQEEPINLGSYAGFDELKQPTPGSYAGFDSLQGSYYRFDELEVTDSSKKEESDSEKKESPSRIKRFFNRIIGKDAGDSK